MLRIWALRILALFRRSALEADFNEEIESHLEMAVEENLRLGMSPKEARAAARKSFGIAEPMKEEFRQQRGVPFIESLVRDAKQGTRSVWRNKPYAFTVMVTLAVCIAANVVTFAIVRSVLLEPLPFPDGNEILIMSNCYPNAGAGNLTQSSPADYFDRLRDVSTFKEQAMFTEVNQTLEIGGRPERVRGMAATPSLFRLLQVDPSLGRVFTAAEGEVGAEHKIILSYGLWTELFARDPAVLEKELRLSGRNFNIVGVMPPEFTFINPELRFWVPLAFNPQQKLARHNNDWYNIGRLKPGATLAATQAQVDALNTANLERFPEFREVLRNAGFHTKVEVLQDVLVRDVKGILYLLWGGAVFVLLIGLLNVANLTLVRLTLRRKELGTRLALGAKRIQLTRQFLVESVLLTASSCVGGLLLGAAILRLLATSGLDQIPRSHEVRVDVVVMLSALGAAIAVGIVIGLLPLTQPFHASLSNALLDGNRNRTSSKGTRRLRQSLVVAQVGFAFILLVGAALLLSSFRQLLRVDPGFETDRVLSAATVVPDSRYSSDVELRGVLNRSLVALRQLPGVSEAGAATQVPFTGTYFDSVIIAEGVPMEPGESYVSPRYVVVSPGYFESMDIRLIQGRYFSDRDNESAPPVVIVDRQLAQRFWPGEDPVGRRMYQPQHAREIGNPPANTRWLTVVGVVDSVAMESLAGTGDSPGAYYLSYAQSPSRSFSFVVRTAADPAPMREAIRSAIASVDAELALFDVRTMAQRRELSLASRRTAMLLSAAFGCLALFLSAVGIYGVLAYHVTQRRQEIGIRVALGSTNTGIAKLIVWEGAILAAIGLIFGIAGAISLRRTIENELFGVRPLDPVVLSTVFVSLVIVVLLASILPAHRATRVNPVEILNQP